MSAARYLLDANICIYIRRQHPLSLLRRFQLLPEGHAAISVIVYGELLYGAEKSSNRDRDLGLLKELLADIAILPLPETAAQTYGAIRAQLAANGNIIGNNDLWIAAHAMAANLILVTNNEREFRRIDGLKVENWAA